MGEENLGMETEKIFMRWDLPMLNNFIVMTFKKNKYKTTSNLSNLQV